MPGEDKVLNGEYFIMNTKLPGLIIRQASWSRRVFPGTSIDMSIILLMVRAQGSKCPKPLCSGYGRMDPIIGSYTWFVVCLCRANRRFD